MGCVARVLLVAGNAEMTTDLAHKLSRRGYSSLIASSSHEALPFAINGHADIVLADPVSAGDLTELTAALSRPGQRQPPLVLLGGSTAGAAALPAGCTDVELFSRLGSLVRLNTMQDELERRNATAEKFGVARTARPARIDLRDSQILLVSSRDTDQSRLSEVLRGVGTLVRANDNFAAVELLTGKTLDAVVIADGAALARQLCSDVRNNSRLYNTPILVIADGDPDVAESICSSGANEVVQQPWSARDIASRTRALVAQHRYRLELQRLYRTARHSSTTDSLTGLYSHGFLHEHLNAQIAAARRRGRTLTLGALDIQALRMVNHSHGFAAGDRLLKQVGGLIGNLVRGEDLTARYGGGSFCVVLPDTAPEVSFFALHRIAGVVDHTEFALLDPEEPVSIRLRIGAAGLEPGDDAQSLIARAFGAVH